MPTTQPAGVSGSSISPECLIDLICILPVPGRTSLAERGKNEKMTRTWNRSHPPSGTELTSAELAALLLLLPSGKALSCCWNVNGLFLRLLSLCLFFFTLFFYLQLSLVKAFIFSCLIPLRYFQERPTFREKILRANRIKITYA